MSRVGGTTLVSSSLACNSLYGVDVLTVANALAYYDMVKVTTVKSFIVQAPLEKKLERERERVCVCVCVCVCPQQVFPT